MFRPLDTPRLLGVRHRSGAVVWPRAPVRDAGRQPAPWAPTSPTPCSACILWSTPAQPNISKLVAVQVAGHQSSQLGFVPYLPRSLRQKLGGCLVVFEYFIWLERGSESIPSARAPLEAAPWVAQLDWLRWQASDKAFPHVVSGSPAVIHATVQSRESTAVEPDQDLMQRALRESELCSIVEILIGDS